MLDCLFSPFKYPLIVQEVTLCIHRAGLGYYCVTDPIRVLAIVLKIAIKLHWSKSLSIVSNLFMRFSPDFR